MKTQCKWSDFNYISPEPLSHECSENLLEIQETKKDRNDLYKDWNYKYFKETTKFRDTVLMNCSNFAYVCGFLGGKYDADARVVLETFTGNPGFFHTDGKFSCNYKKALAFFETKTFEDAEQKPVYGGVYE